jgi:hypothetical protein
MSDSDIPLILCITDHIDGFDNDYHNMHFDYLESLGTKRTILYDWPLNPIVHHNYKNLDIKFKLSTFDTQNIGLLTPLLSYNIHPPIEFDNFLCSFNGSDSCGRQFLVSLLYHYGWFNKSYCSKNFTSSYDTIDGNLNHFLNDTDIEIYRKFIIGSFQNSDFSNFLGETSGFEFNKEAYDYRTDITHLENKITQSFVHLVSECMITSNHPFITEKSLYSIVTRGLFVTYGQCGWHSYFEKYYGFKKYDIIFDYSFDEIKNPIKRLITIFDMLYKFSLLSKSDWHDLYLMEQDTINYNYDHYYSKNFLITLRKYET